MKKTILFVDDEQNILQGLKRMLRPKREAWNMLFAAGGNAALEILARQPVDVIVSDMRMPGMDGVELLTKVMQLHPGVMRIALSGYSEYSLNLRAVLPAHQYLSKPCDATLLCGIIDSGLRAQGMIADEGMRKRISQLERLPVLPESYREIVAEFEKEDPSAQAIGEVIAKDVGMSAKMLKLVNSSFFGFSGRVTTPQEAVVFLGLNVVKSLILYLHIFLLFDQSQVPGFSLKRLLAHCVRTSAIAKMLAEKQGLDKTGTDVALVAGLLHDVGKLLLCGASQGRYNEVLAIAQQQNRRVVDVEQEVLGLTHVEAGAYLMCLWGLPEPVVDAIAAHHSPRSGDAPFGPNAAVYLASILDHKHCIINERYAKPEIDPAYLEALGLAASLPRWEAEIAESLRKERYY